jgi:enterochelin esterase-like enzyme
MTALTDGEILPTETNFHQRRTPHSKMGLSDSSTPEPTEVISPPSTPRSTASPTPIGCWVAGGKTEQDQLETELLQEPLEFRVYTPPCYDQNPGNHYPVIYLIHGQSFNDDQWERLGAGVVADELISTGDVSPFIIVMPRDRQWKAPTEDNFGQAVIEELVPWIDANYRTKPERVYRAVGGLSRGGAWALHLGISNTETFGSIGVHSGFVFHTDTYYVREWLDTTPNELFPRLYLDLGDKDRPAIKESAIWFERLLTEYGRPHEWHMFTGYHEEEYWITHVEDYLRWYAGTWNLSP